MEANTRTELFNAISSHDQRRIIECIGNMDLNFRSEQGTALSWAITGAMYNIKDMVGKGDYATVKLLLDHGANPNYENILYSPLYYATKERRDDIITLLLNYGANLNPYDVMLVKDDRNNDICECRTPLIRAIETQAYLCVEALIYRGALFNSNTLTFADNIKNKLMESRKKSSHDYMNYEDANNIFLIMKALYDPSNEEKVTEFIKNNAVSFKKVNYFVGLEK